MGQSKCSCEERKIKKSEIPRKSTKAYSRDQSSEKQLNISKQVKTPQKQSPHEEGNSEKINKPKKSTKVSPTSSEKQLNIPKQVKAPQQQSPHEEGNSEKINKPKKSTKVSPTSPEKQSPHEEGNSEKINKPKNRLKVLLSMMQEVL